MGRSLKDTDTQHKAEFADIRPQIAGITKIVYDSSIKEDPCEVVIRDLPPALTLTNKQITTAVLVVLQIPDYAQHVVGWSEWSPKRHTAQADPAQQGAAQTTGDQVQPHLNQQPVRGLAFTLSSSVMKKTPLLHKLNCQGDFRIWWRCLSVNALWSASVYALLKHATAAYKQLGHARLIMRPLLCQFAVSPTSIRLSLR